MGNDFLIDYKEEIISQNYAEQLHRSYMKLGKGCLIFYVSSWQNVRY